MKNTIFFVVLFFSIQNSIAQCKLSFEEIYKSASYNFSSFETFALKKGYTYDSKNKTFVCDEESQKGIHQMLIRIEEDGFNLVQSIFFSKQTYLEFKDFLETNGHFKGAQTEDDMLSMQYVYDNEVVLLNTKTFDFVTSYIITVSNQKL